MCVATNQQLSDLMTTTSPVAAGNMTYKTNPYHGRTENLRLHRCAAATAGDATWLHTFFDTATWTTPGGDFVSTPSASTIVADIGSYTWTGPGVIADIQDRLDNGADYGWILRGEEILTQRAQRFVSSDNPFVADRPVLSIEYIPPPPALSIAATCRHGQRLGRGSRWPGRTAVTRNPDCPHWPTASRLFSATHYDGGPTS